MQCDTRRHDEPRLPLHVSSQIVPPARRRAAERESVARIARAWRSGPASRCRTNAEGDEQEAASDAQATRGGGRHRGRQASRRARGATTAARGVANGDVRQRLCWVGRRGIGLDGSHAAISTSASSTGSTATSACAALASSRAAAASTFASAQRVRWRVPEPLATLKLCREDGMQRDNCVRSLRACLIVRDSNHALGNEVSTAQRPAVQRQRGLGRQQLDACRRGQGHAGRSIRLWRITGV